VLEEQGQAGGDVAALKKTALTQLLLHVYPDYCNALG
jgi:hypothetical protein